MMNYGRAFRIIRAARNLAQKDMAEASGLNTSYLSLIENSLRQPSEKSIMAIAKGLKVSRLNISVLAAPLKEIEEYDDADLRALGRVMVRLIRQAEHDSTYDPPLPECLCGETPCIC